MASDILVNPNTRRRKDTRCPHTRVHGPNDAGG